LEIAKACYHKRIYFENKYLHSYVSLTYITKKIKSKMRCGQSRTVKVTPKRTTGEKSDEPAQIHKTTIRRAEFILFIQGGKFGFFTFVPKQVALLAVGCRSPPPINFLFYKNLIGGKDMKNYRDSDYAINKYSKSIVYRFSDRVVVVTLEDYLAENPNKTAKDFDELKTLSDEIYLEQVRTENTQTKKNVSIYGLEETEQCATRSLDEEYMEVQNNNYVMQVVNQLLSDGVLTVIQRRRFILLYFKGLTTRQIAQLEGTTQNAVWKSIHASEIKLKKLFDDGWSSTL
jgi:hypothetical protein